MAAVCGGSSSCCCCCWWFHTTFDSTVKSQSQQKYPGFNFVDKRSKGWEDHAAGSSTWGPRCNLNRTIGGRDSVVSPKEKTDRTIIVGTRSGRNHVDATLPNPLVWSRHPSFFHWRQNLSKIANFGIMSHRPSHAMYILRLETVHDMNFCSLLSSQANDIFLADIKCKPLRRSFVDLTACFPFPFHNKREISRAKPILVIYPARSSNCGHDSLAITCLCTCTFRKTRHSPSTNLIFFWRKSPNLVEKSRISTLVSPVIFTDPKDVWRLEWRRQYLRIVWIVVIFIQYGMQHTFFGWSFLFLLDYGS